MAVGESAELVMFTTPCPLLNGNAKTASFQRPSRKELFRSGLCVPSADTLQEGPKRMTTLQVFDKPRRMHPWVGSDRRKPAAAGHVKFVQEVRSSSCGERGKGAVLSCSLRWICNESRYGVDPSSQDWEDKGLSIDRQAALLSAESGTWKKQHLMHTRRPLQRRIA